MAVRSRTVGGCDLCNKVRHENLPREGKVRLYWISKEPVKREILRFKIMVFTDFKIY